jgi:histidinol-phosphatase (PHP family)
MDSITSVRDMIEGAISKGLEAIYFTDHYDEDYPTLHTAPDYIQVFDCDEYFIEIQSLKEEYKKRIDVRIGVEFGLQTHLGEFYKKLAKKYPFEFIIGSLHVIDGDDPYAKKMFIGKTDEEIYNRMFEETLLNIEICDDFDVLGHLDYVVRYGTEMEKNYSYEGFASLLDAILIALIQRGKGIEVNTSGYRYGLPFPHPTYEVISRYKELGGEIITIGSDGHNPNHIAYNFDKIPPLLESAGFKYYTEFKKRKPYFVKI